MDTSSSTGQERYAARAPRPSAPWTGWVMGRYYTDPQIACTAHQMLTGLDIAHGAQPAPSWQICHESRKTAMITIVQKIRQRAELPEVYLLLPDPGCTWEELPRHRQFRWKLMVMVVAYMASEEISDD